MERKPVLVGLKNGRVTALSIDTSNEERLSFIENGCDSVILMPENSDVPDFKAEYEIKFVDKATPDGFVLVPSGVLDLTRFMCETWTEIDKFVYKNCQNLELYPLIQGSKTQSAIRKIGKQKFNPFAVGAGIQAMIEAQEQE